MTKLNYAQQIKHPEWQKKRLEVLEANGFECSNCGAKDEELHVHHPFYKRGAMIWQYDVDELECLCHKCHKNRHAIDERLKTLLALTDNGTKGQIIGFLSAHINGVPESYEYAEGVMMHKWLNEVLKSKAVYEFIDLKRAEEN